MPNWLNARWWHLDLWSGQKAAILVLVAVLALRVGDPWEIEAIRLKVFDALQTLRPAEDVGEDVILVDIDEDSLAAFGQWPWPRNRLAALLDAITAQGPAAVGFDVLFAEQDQHSPEAFLAGHPDLPSALRAAIEGLPSNDQLFADSIARGKVALGLVAGFGSQDSDPEQLPLPSTLVAAGGDLHSFLPSYQALLRNLPLLERAGSGLGAINLGFERDGVVRRVSTAVRVGDQVLAALPLELARLAGGEASITAVVGGSGIEAVRIGARSVPTDRHGRVWVRFSRGVSHPTVSAKQILFGEAEPGLFRNKLVLVGTTAAGVANYVPTPVGVAMPSLLIHAEVLRTVLSRGPLVRPPSAFVAELLIALLASLLLVATQRRFKARATIVLFAGLAVVLPLATWLAFVLFGWLLDPTFPGFATTAVFVTVVSAGLMQEERARREAARLAESREREKESRIRALQRELLRASRASSFGQLSSAVSHELNQPLAAIHNFVQAARNLARKDEAEAKVKLDGMLEKALGQAERGSSILRGMREVVERGEVSTEEIDINRLMLDAVDLAEEGGSLAGIQVGLALAAGLPPVLANPVQIHQVMINLIQNAGEAMADADPKELTVATKSAGPDMVEVSVSDRGPGLPDEVAANLFKPFVTTKPSGMGLGLSICRAIVEAHGGRLSADRRDGGGTVFRFTLPVAMEGVGPEAGSPSEP